MSNDTKSIGILTAGGDCQGLNAAIRGVAKAAIKQYDMEVIGFLDGFRGLAETEATMPVIYTIGYKGKSLKTFITQLRNAHVDAIIDVRLRNTSHLAGYTKKDTLSFLLPEGFGIAYEHPADIRVYFRSFGDILNSENWAFGFEMRW